MKQTIIVALLLTAAAVASTATAAEAGKWFLTGGAPQAYEIGEDSQDTLSGKPARYIRYVDGEANKFGTLMQQISAKNYKGQRVRFQAMIKTREVSDWAGLWMRIDNGQHSVAFYNSQDKPITGTTGWQLRSVTLDVPADAETLNFGVIDGGKGQVWIDQLSLEAVGKDVPTDVQVPQAKLPTAPTL
jgi:hypothetical protein